MNLKSCYVKSTKTKIILNLNKRYQESCKLVTFVLSTLIISSDILSLSSFTESSFSKKQHGMLFHGLQVSSYNKV